MYRNTAATVHTNSTTEQDCEDEIERHFDNPVYGDITTTEPNTSSQNESHELEEIPPVTYDIANLPANMAAADNGQTYDVLNRGQAKCNGVYNLLQGVSSLRWLAPNPRLNSTPVCRSLLWPM